MKNLNLKPNAGTLITVGIGLLGIVQNVLTNKKEANDKAELKAEIFKEVMDEVIKNK